MRISRRALVFGAASAGMLCGEAAGRVAYVGPEGSERGDGSAGRPWPSVEFALGRGSREIVLLAGVYRGVRVGREFGGTAEAPTVIRSDKKWKAVVLGSVEHGVAVEAPWVVVDGLEVAGSRIDGIKASADGVAIRNCWVHNNAAQGIAIHGKRRWRIERNLIEFNGQHPQLQHGIYADGEDGVVSANVIRHNSGYGVQLYPAMRGVAVVNNLIHGHSTKGGIVLATAGGRSVVANNTIADNAYGVRLMGGAGQVIANNIIVGRGEAVSKDGEAGDAVLVANVTEDPRFVDRMRETYFLAAGSPAIGKASREYAPERDFWGRERSKDAGAFPFVARLTEAGARSRWHNGWPYRFSVSDPRMEMPDLWIDPV